MWLIKTSTSVLEEFVGKDVPKYAILSHTWSKDEVSFGDICLSSYQTKKGYRKIAMTCQLASHAGLKYVWVDTCCIDKSSSSELTEAINSMYRWYERSEICLAYLEDLPAGGSLDVYLQRCRWFTRGWTLQELIAPYHVHFYDQDWNFRGSKQDLMEYLTIITGIDRAVLQKGQSLSSIAVAHKLSWAAHRETTRVEDLAYCLLGLFDINMPLLYGEEEKAFRRLQSEIINTTPDLSIFAWKLPVTTDSRGRPSRRIYCGLMAESPLAFSGCKYDTIHFTSPRRDFSVTNVGIKTRIQVLSEEIPGKRGYRYVLPLDCCGSSGKSLGIRLRKCGPDQFVREDPFNLLECERFLSSNAPRERYLLTRLPVGQAASESDAHSYGSSEFSIAKSRSHVLQIKLPDSMGIYDAWPWGRYDDEDQLFFVQGDMAWDSAALRINVTFVFERNGQPDVNVSFECVFFALGWSETKGNALQCSIMEYSSVATTLSEVQTQLVEWDHDRSQVIDTLEYYKILRSSSAAINIPGTNCSTLMSFKPRLARDQDICPNEFWCVEFFCEVHERKDLPKISHRKWSRDIHIRGRQN